MPRLRTRTQSQALGKKHASTGSRCRCRYRYTSMQGKGVPTHSRTREHRCSDDHIAEPAAQYSIDKRCVFRQCAWGHSEASTLQASHDSAVHRTCAPKEPERVRMCVGMYEGWCHVCAVVRSRDPRASSPFGTLPWRAAVMNVRAAERVDAVKSRRGSGVPVSVPDGESACSPVAPIPRLDPWQKKAGNAQVM